MAPVGAFHFFAAVKKHQRTDRVEKGPLRIFVETDDGDMPLEDLLSLQRSRVKRDCTLQVDKPEEAALRSSTLAGRSSEAELEEAFESSLKSALTSGWCHAKEDLFLRNGGQESRNLAQQKITTSHDDGDEAKNLNKQLEQTPLVSIVPGVAQNMFLDMVVPRSLSPSKRQGRGGC